MAAGPAGVAAATPDDAPTVPVVVRVPTPEPSARRSRRREGGSPATCGSSTASPPTSPAGALAALRNSPDITDVSPDEAVQVQADPSPLHAASAVYAQVVGADRLWAEGIDGDGVTVAVVDTGISPVADLAGRVIGGVDFSGENDPYRDSFGHGTFVAGLIAGNGTSSDGAYTGVAPEANLVSVKIAGRDGASDVSHVLAAIQWAVSFRAQYGIRVLNLSLGTDSTQPYRFSPLNAAVEKAWDSGIVVTVSASNSGPGAGTVTKPGDDPLVVTVGALDDRATPGRGDDVMAGFSGEGPTAADGLTKPDLVAPGRSVVSLRAPGSKIDDAYPGSRVDSAYFKGSGTSFSTALVSGSAALLLQREPGLTADQVKARLMGTAVPGPGGNPNVAGRGSLDTYAAAHAGTFDSANVGVTRSLGTGSIDLDRGSLQVQIETGGILSPILRLLFPVLVLLIGTQRTAQNLVFDGAEYLTSEWSGNRWYESQWEGNRWYSTSWYGNRWYGNRWYSQQLVRQPLVRNGVGIGAWCRAN